MWIVVGFGGFSSVGVCGVGFVGAGGAVYWLYVV